MVHFSFRWLMRPPTAATRRLLLPGGGRELLSPAPAFPRPGPLIRGTHPRQIHHPETRPRSRTATAQGPPGRPHRPPGDAQTLPSPALRFPPISTFYWSRTRSQGSPPITGPILDCQRGGGGAPSPGERNTISPALGETSGHPSCRSAAPPGPRGGHYPHFDTFFFTGYCILYTKPYIMLCVFLRSVQ